MAHQTQAAGDPLPESPTPPIPSGSSGTSGQRERFRDWPGAARWVVYVALGIVVLLLALTAFGTTVIRRSLPQTEGELTVPGLDAKVSVARDARGVPQIRASTTHDLMFAQGYVQAQDRFWQMDNRRLAAEGRLSEIYGTSTLDQDMTARTMGWELIAQQELSRLDDDTVSALEAYSSGINSWLEEHHGVRASAEYAAVALAGDYEPGDWTPVDSLAWLKSMAFDRSGNLDSEVDRARLAALDDADLPGPKSDLFPAYPSRRAPITESPGTTSPDAQSPGSQAAGSSSVPGTGDGGGSNAWVVSGSHTTTGKPLLANDLHLAVSQPGQLYAMGLHCTTVSTTCPYDVSGFGWAGIPGIAFGHNADISWGMSDYAADTTDLYLEKVTGKTYQYAGRQIPLRERDERIRIAGEDSRLITVRSTRHGPVLSDVSRALSTAGADAAVPAGSPARGSGYAVTVDWSGSTPGMSMRGLLGLNRARDWSDFRAAAAQLTAPATGLVYADRDGNIGYQATGAVLAHRAGTGSTPAPGWTRDPAAADRTVPFDRLPSVQNPSSGFIVAAGQPASRGSTDSSSRLEDGADYGFRAERIRALLSQKVQAGAKLRVADMSRIQSDSLTPMANVLVPYLLDVPIRSRYYAGGQRLLADWDGRQPADSAAAAYFNATWRQVLALTFHDDLPESLWPDDSSRWMQVVSRLLEQPDSPWWDDASTSTVEDRDMILDQAMRKARDELVRRDARSPSHWQWGHQHQLDLTATGFGPGQLPMGWLLRRDEIPTPGGPGAVDATGWDPDQGYAVTTAPAMRMVVDLGDFDRSRWVVLGGQSGHLLSGHYTDQVEAWRTGRTFAWPSSRAAIRQETDRSLTLVPGSS